MDKRSMQVKLKGKSLKGKNRIREHGEIWDVLVIDREMLLESLDKKDKRWVEQEDDKDFEIISQGELLV